MLNLIDRTLIIQLWKLTQLCLSFDSSFKRWLKSDLYSKIFISQTWRSKKAILRSNEGITEFQHLEITLKSLLMKLRLFQLKEKFNTNNFMSFWNISKCYSIINIQRFKSWNLKLNLKLMMLIESSSFWLKTQRRMNEEIKWQRDSQ